HILDQIDGIVEIMRQRNNVFTIDRRVERSIRGREDRPCDVVGRPLDRADRVDVRPDGSTASHKQAQLFGSADDVTRLLAEELREVFIRGHQAPEKVKRHGDQATERVDNRSGMAIPYFMASMTIKSTYSLDV